MATRMLSFCSDACSRCAQLLDFIPGTFTPISPPQSAKQTGNWDEKSLPIFSGPEVRVLNEKGDIIVADASGCAPTALREDDINIDQPQYMVLMALLVAQLPVSLTVLLPNAGSYLTAFYFAAGIVMQFLVGYEWMREQVLGMVVLMIASWVYLISAYIVSQNALLDPSIASLIITQFAAGHGLRVCLAFWFPYDVAFLVISSCRRCGTLHSRLRGKCAVHLSDVTGPVP